jgi:uncharacterized protein YbaR (Trm112 family)
MAFKTQCPYCKEGEHLVVVSGTFYATGMALSEDGFAFQEAKNIDTEDEIVRCGLCNKEFPLSEVTE